MNTVLSIIEPIIAATLITAFLVLFSKSFLNCCNNVCAKTQPEPPPFEPTPEEKPKPKRVRKPAAKNLGDVAMKTKVKTAPKIKGNVKIKNQTN